MTAKSHESHHPLQARLDVSITGGKTLAMFEKARGFKAITPAIIRACQEDDSRAWNTFYLHLTGNLSSMICRSISQRTPARIGWKLKRNLDIVDEIFLLAFTKIQRSIAGFNPDNSLEGWLWQIVDSQVVDWVRRNRQQKRGASQTEGEENTISSFKTGPLADDDEEDIFERIPDPENLDIENDIIAALDETLPHNHPDNPGATSSPNSDYTQLIADFCSALDLDDEEAWLLRLNILYLAPLSYPDELDQLSAYTSRSRDFLAGELKKIENRLDAQLEKQMKTADSAGIAATELRRKQLELSCKQLELSREKSDPDAAGTEAITAKDRLEQEIAALRKRLFNKGLLALSPMHPRTEEVARLLGLIDDRSEPGEVRRTIARLNTRMNRLKNKFKTCRRPAGSQI